MPAEDPPTLDYRQPGPPRPWHRRPAVWVAIGIALAALVFVALGMLAPPLNSGGNSNRAMCASNEHQIGLAILLYQQDNAGHYPPALADLLADEQIGAAVFVCPSSNDSTAVLPPTTSPTTQQAAAAFAIPRHLSYLYFGHDSWIDKNVPADAIVLAEPPANHGGDGCNVLSGDGSAQWITMPRAARLIAAAAATTRPVSAASVP
jgi:hypothetical protein